MYPSPNLRARNQLQTAARTQLHETNLRARNQLQTAEGTQLQTSSEPACTKPGRDGPRHACSRGGAEVGGGVEVGGSLLAVELGGALFEVAGQAFSEILGREQRQQGQILPLHMVFEALSHGVAHHSL